MAARACFPDLQTAETMGGDHKKTRMDVCYGCLGGGGGVLVTMVVCKRSCS